MMFKYTEEHDDDHYKVICNWCGGDGKEHHPTWYTPDWCTGCDGRGYTSLIRKIDLEREGNE